MHKEERCRKMRIRFERVDTGEELAVLCKLAASIWRQHYQALLGEEQIAYMLNKFQSEEAVREQILHQNYQYFFIVADGEDVGYVALQVQPEALFLSKLYIQKDFRGHGIARRVVAFLQGMAAAHGLHRIWLTVNKHNEGSIAAYEKLGFTTFREHVEDIGEGYVMDDYWMEKRFI